ncbi:MAG: anaerobic carbon-monoxide dehydrogenase catalytic subunit [Thermodesulfobacteriaceae bacterium]|nr:anaerobic carbon-monoxide dehydrogenase catalytic subunit [Thermodesulfobacteriaceae bacterium]MDW8135629.1 anaerobic carbon-monoxide dehydrogenase catalytic subunit [Thermodesulfobacterium sp.]
MKDYKELTIWSDAQALIKKAEEEGVKTLWDRKKEQEPHCGYCELGLSCRNCAMGPCRIDPFGEGPQKGICGADADIIVARNLVRMIAAGSASHSDHGRDLVEVLYKVAKGEASGYKISDSEKLKRIAQEFGISIEGKTELEIAQELALELMEEYGTKRKRLTFINRVPQERVELWEKLRVIPRGIDREVTEAMHRTHMGVDNDYISLLLHGVRTGLSDGYGGSMIATEVSDIIFGTPEPKISALNFGVLKEDQVNILIHGHNPVVSEMIYLAAKDPELNQLAQSLGAKGINLAGLCCTGNEVLMRKGIPMAGNHLATELVIVTGVVEAMVVDYQCIMPSLSEVAKCYHTLMFSTSDKAKFPGMEHVEFTPENAKEKAYEVVRKAIENFKNRSSSKVFLPSKEVKSMTGFSVEAILKALGGSLEPLINAIKIGKIKGAVGIVGCNNPKIKQDYGHVELAKKLIAHDILVLTTGCANVAIGKAGLQIPEGKDMAGPGLKEICAALGIPPSLHVGSCVDNSRILVIACALAKTLGVDIKDLPIAGAAPEWYSEKAVAIAFYVMASGIFTVLGIMPPILGSKNIVELATSGLENIFGAKFAVEPDPLKAADLIIEHIKQKRKALGLD